MSFRASLLFSQTPNTLIWIYKRARPQKGGTGSGLLGDRKKYALSAHTTKLSPPFLFLVRRGCNGYRLELLAKPPIDCARVVLCAIDFNARETVAPNAVDKVKADTEATPAELREPFTALFERPEELGAYQLGGGVFPVPPHLKSDFNKLLCFVPGYLVLMELAHEFFLALRSKRGWQERLLCCAFLRYASRPIP